MVKQLLKTLVAVLAIAAAAGPVRGQNENPPTYGITLTDTVDPANWQVKAGGDFQAFPLEGLNEGAAVTVKYNGTRKVKSVKAVRNYGMLGVPLTIEALTDGTIVVQDPQSGMQYTLNGGAKTAVTSDAINVAAGDKVAFYGNGTSITSYNGTGISGGTAEVKAYGNIMSLVDENGFATATTLTENYAFVNLFISYANLKDISGLKLPATTLTENCYMSMFSGCTGLTTVPSDLLPATTMASGCYIGMFAFCENLTNVPTLPATTLAEFCYNNMFNSCNGLITVPTDLLPATTLAISCYSYMFLNCFNLTTAPALPATTLAERCYMSMFANCENLAASPVLPATELVDRCYYDMFNGCYKLASVTCLATSGINQNNSTINWLQNAGSTVQGTKTFNAASSAEWPTNSVNGIPDGWTLMTTVTWNSTNVFNSDHENDKIMNNEWFSNPLTYEGVTISISGEEVSSFSAYDLISQTGSLTCYGEDGDSFTFTAPSGKLFCKIEIIDDWGATITNYGDWTQPADNKIVWSGTAASTVTLGTVFTSTSNLNSIVFTLIDAQ